MMYDCYTVWILHPVSRTRVRFGKYKRQAIAEHTANRLRQIYKDSNAVVVPPGVDVDTHLRWVFKKAWRHAS